jgi:PAS domain-containing protein
MLLEAEPDAAVIVDGDGSIVPLNARAEQMFGFAREELLGQPVEMLIPTGARARHVAMRREHAANPKPRQLEVIGMPIWAVLASEDEQAELGEILRRVRDGEATENLETSHRAKDGQVVDIELTISPILTKRTLERDLRSSRSRRRSRSWRRFQRTPAAS